MSLQLFRVEQRGSKWVVTTEDGKRVLGTHDTKSDAEAQLRAVEVSNARAQKAAMAAPRQKTEEEDSAVQAAYLGVSP